MSQHKKVNDQLRVIYNAIGLLPKVNGAYLSKKRGSQQQSLQKDGFQYKRYRHNLDLQKARRRLSHQLKKQMLIDQKQKKVGNYGGRERSVTEVSKASTDELKGEQTQNKQQKLHIIKLSEFLRLRTRQIVVFSNYKKCMNKINSRRQRNASNRTLQQKQHKQINLLFPEGKPFGANKLDSIKIKINKLDVRKLDSFDPEKSQRKKSIQEGERKFSFNDSFKVRHANKNEGILLQGEKLQNQMNNETKFNRWQFNQTKFRAVKKKYGRVNESWEIEHDQIYL